ncbi:MAG: hypothetical protein R3C28_04655 [Pirellulaceae bacterium]
MDNPTATSYGKWSREDVGHKTDQELLEAVWWMESASDRRAWDHRKHLSRAELENVFYLVRKRNALRR